MRRLLHGLANAAEVLHVSPRTNMHVKSRDVDVELCGPLDTVRQLAQPDTVLGTLAPSVCFLAMTVAETGIDSQSDFAAGARAPSWSIMSGEPQFTGML